MVLLKYLVLAVLLCGVVHAQSAEPSIDDTLNQLPPQLQGKVNATDIEDIKNKSTAVFKEKCDKNGGDKAFAAAQKAFEDFPNCVKESIGLSDPAVLQREIEQAKPSGTVDEVFKKYCAKKPEAKQCFRDMTEVVKPCFTDEEQKNLKVVYNLTEQLIEFICYKDGDRIALFIAEDGPECFQEKQEQIQECFNKTLGSDFQLNTGNLSVNSLPEINFGEKECEQMSQLQLCVVDALEKCHTPTSANIVESLFKFARQSTPCKNSSDPTKKNSVSSLAVTSATLAVSLVAAILL